jgi:hypothetical protein
MAAPDRLGRGDRPPNINAEAGMLPAFLIASAKPIVTAEQLVQSFSPGDAAYLS